MGREVARRLRVEEDGVAPVDHLELVGIPIPEDVLGVHIVIEDALIVSVLEQVQHALKDGQQFEVGQALALRGEGEGERLEGLAGRHLDDDVLMLLPADAERAAVQQLAQDGMAAQQLEGALLVQDTPLLPGADGRGILQSGALDHAGAVAVERIVARRVSPLRPRG